MKKIGLAIIIAIILFTTICNVNAQTQTENMRTFFDNEIQEIKITVNATAETQPNENITVKVTMNSLREVYVNIKYFNFSVFGFINGTDKTMIYNITKNNFPLPYECNFTCPVPEQVWGVTHGEITLIYDATYTTPPITIPYEDLIGFSMTYVENVYFENLSNIFEQLNQTFRQYSDKDLTPENLNETLQKLKGSQNELGNTRMAVAVLAITTVFFVATTAYLVLRKPRESW